MQAPEVHTEQIELPGLGILKLEWLVRDILRLDEITNNLIMHIYHVRDDGFMDKVRAAWESSGIANLGIAIEMSYTDQFEGFPIDAFDVILYAIDPCMARSYKSMFVSALQTTYQEIIDGRKRQPLHPTNRNEMQEMQSLADEQEGPED